MSEILKLKKALQDAGLEDLWERVNASGDKAINKWNECMKLKQALRQVADLAMTYTAVNDAPAEIYNQTVFKIKDIAFKALNLPGIPEDKPSTGCEHEWGIFRGNAMPMEVCQICFLTRPLPQEKKGKRYKIIAVRPHGSLRYNGVDCAEIELIEIE